MRLSPFKLRATGAALALSFSTILSAPHVQAAETSPAAPITAEREFLGQVGLGEVQRVKYRDPKGAPISFQQFLALQSKFPSFSMEKTKHGKQTSAVISLQAAAPAPSAPQYKLKPGTEFPAFKLAATDNTLVDSAALRGKYTLINFYFADCAPCIKEVPMLNAFAASRKDMTVLALTFDNAKESKAFASKTQFGWRTIASAKKLIDQVGVKGYPTFALLDPKGVLVAFGDQGDVGGTLDKWVTTTIAAKAK